MKKLILSIAAVGAACASAVAQTGNTITAEFIVNSGTAPILVSGTTKATGTLTLNAQPSPGDVITLGTFSYTYKSAVSETANQILISSGASGSLANTISNTINAITTGGTTNPNYYTSGSNTSASAAAGAGNTVLVTAYASGTAGNAVVTTGSFTSPANSWGAPALSGGAVASGTSTICVLPPNGGSYVFTAADVLCLGGTLTAAPSVAIQSGGATVLSGTVALTGTTPNSISHIAAAASPLPVVVTGTNAAPIQLKVTSNGTATSPFTVKVFVKGYWLTLP
jgi:hypothetical protein